MTRDPISVALRERIFDAFPVSQPSFLRLLNLLDIEASEAVPTAAVTLGERSRLRINPEFVRRMCRTDHDLVMLVLHELHHVALGHTRLFPRVTRAQNWAFDCVINAQLSRLFPQPRWTSLFCRSYRADRFPEALLRPPEGWRTDYQRWLPGRAGQVHRALYNDTSVSYRDLFELLPQLLVEAGAAGALDRLLGNHGDDAADTGAAPDVLREVRDILAEWPMVEERSGRDQGGERRTDTVACAAAQRQAVAQIRRALLAVAVEGHFGAYGSPGWEDTPSVLPYASRLARSDFVRAALGGPALLHETNVQMSLPRAQERTHVYLDVSGSMSEELPLIYAALRPLAPLLYPKVHLFSTEVTDIGLGQLARGVRVGTGGTSFAPVTQHLIEQGIRRAVFITDGWVGSVPAAHAHKLARRRCRFAAVVSARGDASFTKPLDCRLWRLPAMEY